MIWLVGLGNPGEKYAHTRHNVGWQILDHACAAWNFPSLVVRSGVSGRVCTGSLSGHDVSVLYPNTFMNESGSAVVKCVPKGTYHQLIVVHDDIDLPFGEVKISQGRGAGGNNGVASIITALGTKNFIRVRVGIAPKNILTENIQRPAGGGPLERFVLKPFGILERGQLPSVYEKARTAIELVVTEGVEKAMNQCH